MYIDTVEIFYKISETTLQYFFSTLAQSFAALTAFFFAAAQSRISWLDEKITTGRKSIIYTLHGHSYHSAVMIDFQISTMSATAAIKRAQQSNNQDIVNLGNQLASRVIQMQALRKGIRNFVLLGIGFTLIGIVGVPFSKPISESEFLIFLILVCMLPLIVITLCWMGHFIYQSLKVSLVYDIENAKN